MEMPICVNDENNHIKFSLKEKNILTNYHAINNKRSDVDKVEKNFWNDRNQYWNY